MSDEVIEYIATHITDNIRELEGALISLLAQSTLNKKEITLDLAKEMIDKLIKNTKREVSIDYIQKVVCNYYDIGVDIASVQNPEKGNSAGPASCHVL